MFAKVPAKVIEEGALKLTVIDVDRHKRHHVIGHVIYPLKAHAYEGKGRMVVRKDLQNDTQEVGHIVIMHALTRHT